MNVDVLNRSGLQAASASKLAIADCDIHPRPAGVGIGGVSKSLYPYLSKRWVDHVEEFGITFRQPWEKGSAYPKNQPLASRRDSFVPGGGAPTIASIASLVNLGIGCLVEREDWFSYLHVLISE